MQGLNLMPFSRRSSPWPMETRSPALCELSGLTCCFFPGIPSCHSLPQTCTQIRPEPKTLTGPLCGPPARSPSPWSKLLSRNLPFGFPAPVSPAGSRRQRAEPEASVCPRRKPSRFPEAASGNRKHALHLPPSSLLPSVQCLKTVSSYVPFSFLVI